MLHDAKHCDSIYGYSLQIAFLGPGFGVVGKVCSGCESTVNFFLVVGVGRYHLFKSKPISEWCFDENAYHDGCHQIQVQRSVRQFGNIQPAI